MGLSTVVVQGGMSLGVMVIGSLGAAIGIGAALSIGGGVFAASAATGLAVRSADRSRRTASAVMTD